MRIQSHARSGMDQHRRSTAVKPLGYNELCVVADAVADVAPHWSVELSGSALGESSLVIMPEGADDLIGPTFVVHQDRAGFRLDQFQWDTLSGIGAYASLYDAMRAVLACLAYHSPIVSAYSPLHH
jgi:hypothetical protein